MKVKILLQFLIVLTLISSSSGYPNTPFRLMTYNGLNVQGSTIGTRTAYFQTVIQGVNPDILLMQEIKDAAGCDSILGRMNSSGGNQFARVSLITGPDTYSMMFYRTSKVTFISQDTIATALRSINEYIVSISGNIVRLYSCHLKSSQGYEPERLAEVTALRVHLNSLAAGSEFIIVGDMNFYTSTEPAYQKFIANESNNIGRAQDLSPLVGNWHDGSAYVMVHTQSTRTRSFGYGATGGLDDRFDFILTNYGMNNSAGIEYVENTYTVFGNDGNHLNDSINRPPNGVVSMDIANALHYAADHLPVYADFISLSSTAVDQDPLPAKEFILHQNYPNPFNPTTTIQYDVKEMSKVTLKIYNVNGQEVRTLVNMTQNTGTYSVVWDGKDYAGIQASSGVYIYRIQAGNFVKSHKMILAK